MKNQYFGDINDYKKYGILRILSNRGKIRIGICWMLTEDNNINEGNFTSYIHQPKRWREFDPPLFKSLECAITLNQRNVKLVEQMSLIENSHYFANILGDSSSGREIYFNEFSLAALSCDLIFFDPDNGIEVKSKPYCRSGSNKYVYWKELISFYEAGYSLLIYQHFPRLKREIFIENIMSDIRSKLKTELVMFFLTSNVLFILITQKKIQDYFLAKTTEIES